MSNSTPNKVAESLVREDTSEKSFTVTSRILKRFWGEIVQEISIGDLDLTEFLLKKDVDLPVSLGSYSNNEAVLTALLENGGDKFGSHLCYMALRESIASRVAGSVNSHLSEIVQMMEQEAATVSSVNNTPGAVLRIEQDEGPALPTGSKLGMPENKSFIPDDRPLPPSPAAKQLLKTVPEVNPSGERPLYRRRVSSDSIFLDLPKPHPTSSPIPGDTDSNLSFPYSPGRQASN